MLDERQWTGHGLHQIRNEGVTLDSDSQKTSHLIWIKGEAEPFACGSDERVLYAIESTPQQSVRVGCRQGGCGACRVRILSGEYHVDKMSLAHVSEEDREVGYALSCRLYPRSDLTLEAAFVSPSERRKKSS